MRTIAVPDSQESDCSGPSSDTGEGKAIDVSQPNTKLDDMPEQGITTGDEESKNKENHNEDASYAGQISNPAGLPYSITGRLLPGSAVTLEFAKDQYLHVTVDKDSEDSDQGSGQAGKLNTSVLPQTRS